jgi:hypothetical protein
LDQDAKRRKVLVMRLRDIETLERSSTRARETIGYV